jgi:hypothetical protein
MKAMHEEMDSIQKHGTWILVGLPPRKKSYIFQMGL